jgi:A/G-specific adenine glycosylase
MKSAFSQQLLKWYDKNKRDLPWRHTKNPYYIWVSEVMLQQTTVSAVIPYYERWIKSYPTVFKLAKTPIQNVLKSWQGLGYYNRARNLHKAAGVVVSVHQGKLPADALLVRALPGFGPYTTASVLSIAFDQPLVIIDANVRRLVMRLLAIQALADTKQDGVIQEYLKKVIPAKRAGDFNQALMEMGALVCRTKEPTCNTCPLQRYCLAYTKGIQELIPTPKKKIIKEIDAVIAIIIKDGKYLIQQRPSKGLLADLWEFPGGKVEAGETAPEALKRELQEELGVNLTHHKHLFDVTHFYTQFRIQLKVFQCTVNPAPKSAKTRLWVKCSQLNRYPMPSGSAKILDKLSLV